jgi:hypothetical protein
MMTLGFAAALWVSTEPPTVLVAADTRLSADQMTLTDAGIKTYELGGCAAMVAAGHALPALTAAETVRPIVENHNRRQPSRRMSFYDTCRLLGFFLKRSAEQQGWSCEAVVAGFLSSRTPALAHLVVSPERNRVSFFQPEKEGFIVIPVGNIAGKRLLLRGLMAAKREKRKLVASGVGLLWYMSRHPGAFTSIGGGISVGSCGAQDDAFSWPVVEIDGRLFMRGFDVTQYYRPGWPPSIMLPYDESWCSVLDQQVDLDPPSVDGFIPEHGSGYEIDSLSTSYYFDIKHRVLIQSKQVIERTISG